jgi:hypothetical protein
MTTGGNLSDVRARLKTKKLSDDDVRYIDGLLARAEAEGLGAQVGNRRVIARLPHGMDIVK